MKESAVPAPGQEWFTVQEAAELLRVPVTRIYDSIRDGRLRVRFHSGEEGGHARPLVTSPELRGRSSGDEDREGTTPSGQDDPASSTLSDNGAPPETETAPVPPTPEAAHQPVPDPPPADAAPPPAALPPADEPSPAAADAAPATATDAGRRTLADERLDRERAERALEEATRRRELLEIEVAEERSVRGQVLEKLAAESRLRQSAEEKGRTTVAAAEDQRKQLETRLEAETRRCHELQQELDRTRADLAQELDRTRADFAQELERTRTSSQDEAQRARAATEQVEDRLEQSLKAVYERDVKIAGLQEQVKAGDRVQEKSTVFSDRLHERIQHLEEATEQKELEIRRLALGLGEAQGEIKLLRPPQEEAPARWRRLVPAALVLGFAGFLSWLTHRVAASDRALEAASLAAFGAIATFVVFLIRDRVRRKG